MLMAFRVIPDGTITSPRGFSAGATAAGIKTIGERPLDLGLLLSASPCVVAGMFTTNALPAAPTQLNRESVARGQTQGLIANSGNANSFTGEQGLRDAHEMARLGASKLGLTPESVIVASTGLIGSLLPMPAIESGLKAIMLAANGGHQLAQAITTTDTFPKERAVSLTIDGREVTIGGIAKGAGMIHPNMATMLSFIATDATVEQSFLQETLRKAVDRSFNMITIDGDTSTNDMVIVFANGMAGNEPLSSSHPDASAFVDALQDVCRYLAVCIARDGEGATRLLTIEVNGAASEEDARKAARTVAGSMLFKSAVHGADPNWGRLVAALGRSGARLAADRIDLYVGDVRLVARGQPVPFDQDAARQAMLGREVLFKVELGLGSGEAIAWGCDLSPEYVTFNSAYTT
jgi:glutamate N-acetyltransferase/amino-acid N-acetyltransferase